MLSQSLGGSGAAFKNRLANFVDDEDDAEIEAILKETSESDGENNATMSKSELAKRAKEQKKLAKQNAKDNK